MTGLLFVYNANGGALNGLLDTLHKTLSPGTYACSLCALTYGATSMRPEWRRFLQQLPATTSFLHRAEWHAQHPELRAEPLPAVFRQTSGGSWELYISAAELGPLDLPGFMRLIQERL